MKSIKSIIGESSDIAKTVNMVSQKVITPVYRDTTIRVCRIVLRTEQQVYVEMIGVS